MTLSVQFITLITMILSGFYLGVIQETFRRFTVYWKGRLFFTYFLEILFWITQAGILFYILYRVNQGEIRLYIILACLLGFSMYQALAKKLYLKLLERFIRLFSSFYRGILRLINLLVISPLQWIFFTIYRMIKTTLFGAGKILLWLCRLVFTPFRWMFLGVFRLLPEPVQKFFLQMAGFCSKIKNIICKWIQLLRRR